MHRDSNYQGSRGLKALHLYDTDTLRRLLQIQTSMNDNENFPRNYDLCISVLSASFDILGLMGGLDNKMQREHPEIFGHDEMPVWPRMIVVYAQWVPFSPSDKPDESWFDQLKNDCWFTGGVREKPMSQLVSFFSDHSVRESRLTKIVAGGGVAFPEHKGVRPAVCQAHVLDDLDRAEHKWLG